MFDVLHYFRLKLLLLAKPLPFISSDFFSPSKPLLEIVGRDKPNSPHVLLTTKIQNLARIMMTILMSISTII